MPEDYDYTSNITAAKTRNVVLTADSASDSNISFSTTTPSTRTYVSRYMLLDLTFKLSYNHDQATALAVHTWSDSTLVGPRQWPVNKIISNTSLVVNDQSLSMATGDTVNELMRYNLSTEERNQYYAGTAHYTDISYTYEDAPGTRNPFAQFDNSGLTEDTRSPGNMNITLEADPTGDYFLVRITEPLIISPLVFGKASDDEPYLVGVQNVSVNLTLARLQKLWSGAIEGVVALAPTNSMFRVTDNAHIDPTLFAVSMADSSKQRLHMTFKTPPPQQIIPRSVSYSYNNVRRFPQKVSPALLPGESNSFQLNSITLSSVPSRVYVYARPLAGLNDFRYPDFHSRIKNISLTWDNTDGLLQGQSTDGFDLYVQNVRCGYNESFAMTKRKGCIVCIDFDRGDVSMAPLSATGVRGNYNMSLNVTMEDVRNPAVATVVPGLGALDYEINLLVIENGVFQIFDSLVSVSVGLLSSSILANAPFGDYYVDPKAMNFYGGGVKDVMKGILKVIKKGLPVITDVANAASSLPGPVGSIARGTAIGSEIASNILGKGLRKSGGAVMSSSDLSRRL